MGAVLRVPKRGERGGEWKPGPGGLCFTRRDTHDTSPAVKIAAGARTLVLCRGRWEVLRGYAIARGYTGEWRWEP